MIPSTFASICYILFEVINLKYIGFLNNATMLAGVGMGNMTLNICCTSIIFGFNGALDTLIS
jgi:hypothetical protein